MAFPDEKSRRKGQASESSGGFRLYKEGSKNMSNEVGRKKIDLIGVRVGPRSQCIGFVEAQWKVNQRELGSRRIRLWRTGNVTDCASSQIPRALCSLVMG